MRRTRTVLVCLAATLLLGSCQYLGMARGAQSRGEPVPWWCNPIEEIPVTDGPASGTIDWYAGTHKAPLSWDDCLELSELFDEAREWALQWPTAAVAEADGWKRVTPYFAGMGTHHVRGGITPEMLASPTFDRHDPILDDLGLDDVFEPTRPDVLQFDGNGPNAKLVGFDYYVRTDTGLPPEGFEGNNDWWHHHPWICHRKTDAQQIGFNISDSSCTSMGGVNVNLSNYYMLHVWNLDDMVFTPDVYAGQMPCITSSGTIHDPMHSCHVTRGGSSASAAHDHTLAPGLTADVEPHPDVAGAHDDHAAHADHADHHGGG